MSISVKRCALCEKSGRLCIDISLTSADFAFSSSPRLKAVFACRGETRIIPLAVEISDNNLTCSESLRLDSVFYRFDADDTALNFELWHGDERHQLDIPGEIFKADNGITLKNGDIIIPQRLMKKRAHYTLQELKNKEVIKQLVRRPFFILINLYYQLYCLVHPVVKNRVTFMSGRRKALGGNSEFVYNELKDNKDLDIKFLFYEQKGRLSTIKVLLKFISLYATSNVVVVDDFFRMLNFVNKRKEVTLVQLWHACGAFKTFGFTRLGKVGGPLETTKSHRMYDYTLVSSKEIVKCYAEGFGISCNRVLPLGVARTDVFFDSEYSAKTRARLYEKYSVLKDKKVVLFAPTFRGNGQQSAFYPEDKFDAKAFMSALGDEYALIIKLHPFCKERIDLSGCDRAVDLSNEDELNDLLFVTDILITDYSSVVFEASLLNIPMLFYAYDLEEYIKSRDFYYDFTDFVPGKIVKTQSELEQSIVKNDFESEKVCAFKNKFFDDTDGAAAKRAAELICRGEL